MRRCLLSTTVLAAVLFPGFALAQSSYAGPEFGVFLPTDGALKTALGDQWFSVGISTMKQGDLRRSNTGTNMNFVTQAKNGNKVFIGSYSIGLFQPFGDGRQRNSSRPYFAARAGVSYIDYAIGVGINRDSGKRVGYNANAELGILFGDRLNLSVRYDVNSKHDGYSFDGLSVSLRYGLAKF
ncbi:MAG: hypothetical protein LCH41_01920 [Armatimonadetes bacterium]|nr:hypothetical protein [Armatimonadota bacterium]